MNDLTEPASPRGEEAVPPRNWTAWLWGALLFVATAIAYEHIRHAGFIWDDDMHLTKNPCIVGPLGFAGIWTTSAATYYPLTLTSFWIQHALWGLNPLPYHIFNVAMHAACAVALWRVLLALNLRGAWFAAAVWALHPVQVESAAWITELKNTQSCLFYLLGALAFLKWLNARNAVWYTLALLCAVAAILSKASTVMLPVVLGLCWWWQERRWHWRNVLWLLPFLAISLGASAWTIWEQQYHSGAIGEEWNQTLPQRIIIAGKVIWFYLGKLLWPHPLIFIYPRWQINAADPLAYFPIAAAIVTGLLLWWYRGGVMRAAFFAYAYFVVSLVPVLGIFNVYFFRYSYVGDHLQYLATIGPLVFIASLIVIALRRLPAAARAVATPGVCGALLLTLGILTWRETFTYTDEETLWRTTIARNPGAWIGHNNLGKLDRPEEALAHFRRALELYPRFSHAHNNIAAILMPAGQVDEALRHWAAAIEIEPTYGDARYNYGSALLQLGRASDAIPQLQVALQIDPANADAHYNLASAYLQTGQRADAVASLEKALTIKPQDIEVLTNLAWLLSTSAGEQLRNGRRAVELARRADELAQGENVNVATTLAAAYAEARQFADAVATAQRALSLANAPEHAALADAIRRQLALYEAGSPYRE